MKIVLPALALLAAALVGCTQSPPVLDPRISATYRQQRAFDMWTVDSIQQAAMKNAVIEQHAIYPYDFAPNSAALTELAKRDLA